MSAREGARKEPTDIVRGEAQRLLDLLRALPLGTRAKVHGGLSSALMDEPLVVDTPKGPLAFVVLGAGSAIRAKNLMTKQPATIAWIDSFEAATVFWDIGANVGTYTLYAAQRQNVRVVAFEPAAVNFFLLAANCERNAFHEHVTCLQIGLGAGKSVGRLELSQFEPAASFSFRGKEKRPFPGRQAALILSMDQLIDEYGVPCPNYIKVDVPGLTEAIIDGGAVTLQRPEVREVHIEMREHSPAGRRIVERLAGFGLAISARHDRSGTVDLTFARSDAGSLR